MAGRFWAASLVLASSATPLAAQTKAPPPPLLLLSPPPAPIAVSYPERATYGRVLVEASEAWANGEPDKALGIFDKTVRDFKYGGPDAQIQNAVRADRIVALTYADPTKAETELDAWEKRNASGTPLWPWSLTLLPVRTRVLLARGKAAEARALIEAGRADLAQRETAFYTQKAADIKAKIRKKNAYEQQDTIFWNNARHARRKLDESGFLLATHERGEAAFAEFAGTSANPFFENDSQLSLHSAMFVTCASAGLTPQDWMMADVGFDRDQREMFAFPYAVSRPEAIQPLLEGIDKISIAVRGMRTVAERQKLLVRCTRSVPAGSATELMPDYTYMRELLLPLVKDLDGKVNYNIFTDPVTDLVRDGHWITLLNYAYAPYTAVPEKFGPAQSALLSSLKAMPKPDPVAIAIVTHWMLPDAAPGQTGRVRDNLPLYMASVAALKDVPNMPPRVQAYLEFRLGEMHEIVGDMPAAEALYRAIVARAPITLAEKSSEVTRARLRLAAIAEASGRYAESAVIFDALGLSPEQCSLYQARPAITSFRSPDYPSAALRQETEGNVQFEFDLDEAGRPTNFRVLASTPPFVFDRETIRSFSKATFAPATRGGKALPCEAAIQNFAWRIAD